MKRVLSECLKPSSAATTVRKAASEIIIIIDDDDDDDNDGGALSSLRQRAPRPLTCQVRFLLLFSLNVCVSLLSSPRNP